LTRLALSPILAIEWLWLRLPSRHPRQILGLDIDADLCN